VIFEGERLLLLLLRSPTLREYYLDFDVDNLIEVDWMGYTPIG